MLLQCHPDETDLHPGEGDRLLQPLLEVRVDLVHLPLLPAGRLRLVLEAVQLHVEAGHLVLHLQLLLGHSLQVLAQLGLRLLGHIELLRQVEDGDVVVVAAGLPGLADTLLAGFLVLLAALLLLSLALQAV